MMRVIDPGHLYAVASYDGGEEQIVQFVKREGDGYPGNVGSHSGTNCQELIRVLIDRIGYLDRQIAAPENATATTSLRAALIAFEERAARRHGRRLPGIEAIPACPTCGHIHCEHVP